MMKKHITLLYRLRTYDTKYFEHGTPSPLFVATPLFCVASF